MNRVGAIPAGMDNIYNDGMPTSHNERAQPTLGKPARFQFRLIHLLYAVALLGGALAAFEPWPFGCLIGGWAVFTWTALLAQRRPPTLVEIAVIVLTVLLLIGLMLPAVGAIPELSPRGRACAANLRQIGIALQNYHQRYGCFPPAFVAGEDGRPKHSWRVLILPFLGQQALYDAYDFRQPWNGPRNQQLAAKMPDVYRCEGDERTSRRTSPDRTPYLAVVGPHTAWPGATSRKLTDFVDRPSETVAVLEADPQDVAWLEPGDLTVDEALHLLSTSDPQVIGGHRGREFAYSQYVGRHGLLADGDTLRLGYGIRAETATMVLNIDDGKVHVWRGIRGTYHPAKQYEYGPWFRLALFVGLLLAPLPWARSFGANATDHVLPSAPRGRDLVPSVE